MCAPEDPPGIPDNESEYSDDFASSAESNTPYTPDELADIFLDFYQFLTTLHFDSADLKTAPLQGWPTITREARPDWKSDLTIEVLRRLPYFNASTNKAMIHYKSILIDYSSMDPKHFSEEDYMEDGMEFWNNDDITDSSNVFAFASGRESGGRFLWLDVEHGLITEDLCRVGQLSPEDVRDWFCNLKNQYRSLQLIPSKGRATIEADEVPERAAGLGLISKEEVCAQTEEQWGTDLDIHYLRQLYRQHGWPDAFRREDAERAVQDLMDTIEHEDRRMGWEQFYVCSPRPSSYPAPE
ncbi:hypothetical protein CDD83_6994 [Cordyceps sp. RAO-2017]|nr:hypothetical protein CDD83_6994 [Cordyceps sp. RAO-2017]